MPARSAFTSSDPTRDGAGRRALSDLSALMTIGLAVVAGIGIGLALGAPGPGPGPGLTGEGQVGVDGQRHPGGGAVGVEHAVAGDAEQPPGDGPATRVEPLAGSPRADERLLGEVLRLPPAAGDDRQGPEEPLLLVFEELLEGHDEPQVAFLRRPVQRPARPAQTRHSSHPAWFNTGPRWNL